MKKTILFVVLCLALAACAPAAGNSQALSTTPAQAASSPTSSLPTSQIPTSTSTSTAVSSSSGLPAAATSQSTQAPTSTQASSSGGSGTVPNFDHIILIMLENRGYNEVIGNSSLPTLNALAKQNVLLSQYYSVTHPSLPNYIALMSGSTQGITSDCTNCYVNAPNLADEITASKRTWKAYEESMPSPCFVGSTGTYAQKHDPLIYFNDIRQNTALCQKSIVPLTQLTADLAANQLPNFAFIMPNLCNSGHNCSGSTPDTWVGQMVSQLQASPALGKNYLIIITWDEAATSDKSSCCGLPASAGGRVATILISPQAKLGFVDSTPVSEYGLLKTILTAWSLPDLGFTSNPASQPITTPWQ